MSIGAGNDILASDFVSTSAGAGDVGKVIKLDAEGLFSETALPVDNFFGGGSDGNVTISSPTTLTRDMFYDTLTVSNTLTTNGFRIFCKTEITGTGTVSYPTGNVGGNASGKIGGNGGDGFSGALYGTLLNTPGSGGGGGANQNASAGGAGGTGGNNLTGNAGSSTSGYGGTGGAGGGGGGGGASGGIIFISAKKWSGTFTIQAIGGAGGNGANASGVYSGGTSAGASGGNALNYKIGTANNNNGGNGGGGATGGTGGSSSSLGQVFGIEPFTTFNFIEINQGFTLVYKNMVGAGGGGGGNLTGGGNGGGGGGGGGKGGTTVVVYLIKTWTGSYVLTGGAGGTKGLKSSSGTDGTDGTSGATGVSYEIQAQSLIS